MAENWAGLQYPLIEPRADPELYRNWLLDRSRQQQLSIGPPDPVAALAQAQQAAGSLGPPLPRDQQVVQALTEAVRQGEGFGMTGLPALGYPLGVALAKAGHPEAGWQTMAGSLAADALLSAGAPMGPREVVNRLSGRPSEGYGPREALRPGPYLPAGQYAAEAPPSARPRVPRVGRFVARMPNNQGQMRATRTHEAYLAQHAADAPTFEAFKESAQRDRVDFESAVSKAALKLSAFGGPGGTVVPPRSAANREANPSEYVRLGVVGDFLNNPGLRAQYGKEALKVPVYVVNDNDPAISSGIPGWSSYAIFSPVSTTVEHGATPQWYGGGIVLGVGPGAGGKPQLLGVGGGMDWTYNPQTRRNEQDPTKAKVTSLVHETAHAAHEARGRGWELSHVVEPSGQRVEWEKRPVEHSAVRATQGLFKFFDLTQGMSDPALRDFYDRTKRAQAKGQLVEREIRAPKGTGPRAASRVRAANASALGLVGSPQLLALGAEVGVPPPPAISRQPGVTTAIRLGNGDVWVGKGLESALKSANAGTTYRKLIKSNTPSLSDGVVYRDHYFRLGTAQRLGLAGMDRAIVRGEAGPKIKLKNPQDLPALGAPLAPLPKRGAPPPVTADFAPPPAYEPTPPPAMGELSSRPVVPRLPAPPAFPR